MTSRFLIICYFLQIIEISDAYWISPPVDGFRSTFLSALGKVPITGDSQKELPLTIELQSGDDPCWQNMLDDDCSMGNIYAANFVASKWIQSMPCGEGIEDCDMPSALSSPDSRPEAGVEQLDVMEFLGLKRAATLSKK